MNYIKLVFSGNWKTYKNLYGEEHIFYLLNKLNIHDSNYVCDIDEYSILIYGLLNSKTIENINMLRLFLSVMDLEFMELIKSIDDRIVNEIEKKTSSKIHSDMFNFQLDIYDENSILKKIHKILKNYYLENTKIFH